MIVYKWVIKENNYYKPIVNNGAIACRGSKDIKLPYYFKGKTISGYIDILKILNIKHNHNPFHRSGFHFWKNMNDFFYPYRLKSYQNCMKNYAKTKINCVLKCYVREKDIILQNDEQIIAKQFRILYEV